MLDDLLDDRVPPCTFHRDSTSCWMRRPRGSITTNIWSPEREAMVPECGLHEMNRLSSPDAGLRGCADPRPGRSTQENSKGVASAEDARLLIGKRLVASTAAPHVEVPRRMQLTNDRGYGAPSRCRMLSARCAGSDSASQRLARRNVAGRPGADKERHIVAHPRPVGRPTSRDAVKTMRPPAQSPVRLGDLIAERAIDQP